jgi:dTDP-4-amino-4,6-dideoxygalactose transaminase
VDHAPEPPTASFTVEAFVASLAGSLDHSEALLTYNGRSALAALLQHLELRRTDEVFITTTFDYPNVSSCVTSTVFNFCKPARVMTAQTRAILVIHEFGVVHPETPGLRKEALRRGIPLIEDCAHTIASSSAEGWRVGKNGDWVIVSLPKVLPVTVGGLLLGPAVPYSASHQKNAEMLSSMETAASWWPLWADHIANRRSLYDVLARRFRALGLSPLFDVSDNITPWFFPVAIPHHDAILASAYHHGVDCALWHGTDIVVFPCHQFLTNEHVNRIVVTVEEGLAA